MHELSICHSITDIVGRHAAGSTVQTVRLRIGELRQIVPDTLTYCWGLVTEGSELASAKLEIERVPATIKCSSCGAETVLSAPVFVCSKCDGQEVEVVAGEEFLITSLELAEA